MSISFRFFLYFILGVSLAIAFSACGGSFPEDDIKTTQPTYCHDPANFVGPQPKECY